MKGSSFFFGGSPSFGVMDELVIGKKKGEKHNQGLLFVGPDKKTNVRNRRNKPCQISITEATQKR